MKQQNNITETVTDEMKKGMKVIYFEEPLDSPVIYGFIPSTREEPADYELKVGEIWLDDNGDAIEDYLGSRWISKDVIDDRVGREITRKEWDALVQTIDRHVDKLCDKLNSKGIVKINKPACSCGN